MQVKKQTRSLFKTVVVPQPKEALPVWVVVAVIAAGVLVAQVAGEPVASFLVHNLSR